MRIVKLVSVFLFVIGNLCAQEDIEKNALLHANKMALHFNNRDFTSYVDCLLPTTYSNNPANKKGFAEVWKTIIPEDNPPMQIAKVLKYSLKNNQYQALLLEKSKNKSSYIFGVSNDKGKNWLFTTSYSNEIHFEQIIEVIPSLDTSFAKIVDPKFGKRISYEKEKVVAPFKYTDIKGNILSSDALKGKVLVLNFWSTTCGPCITEIPELNELVERMKGKDVVFIAPAVYTPKEELINRFLPKHPFSYQIVLIDNNDYSVTSFPTHILIGKNLKTADTIIGYNQDNIKRLEQKILTLLEE